jgi:hypothetical protein
MHVYYVCWNIQLFHKICAESWGIQFGLSGHLPGQSSLLSHSSREILNGSGGCTWITSCISWGNSNHFFVAIWSTQMLNHPVLQALICDHHIKTLPSSVKARRPLLLPNWGSIGDLVSRTLTQVTHHIYLVYRLCCSSLYTVSGQRFNFVIKLTVITAVCVMIKH